MSRKYETQKNDLFMNQTLVRGELQ